MLRIALTTFRLPFTDSLDDLLRLLEGVLRGDRPLEIVLRPLDNAQRLCEILVNVDLRSDQQKRWNRKQGEVVYS